MVGEPEFCFYGSTLNAAVTENPLAASVETLTRPERAGGFAGERPKVLGDAAVITLDGYGTLVDRESGIIGALMPWLHEVGVAAGRGEILRAFALAERANLTPGVGYRDVLIRVHDTLSEFFDVAPDRDAAEEFAASVGHWPIHPDAPAALAYLKQHVQLVVLTNADHASFDVTNKALGVEFDAVYTSDDTGCYKPSVGAFEYLLGKLDGAGISKHQVLHVAGSIRFDHVPAKRLGMTTCWIHRKHARRPSADARKRGLDVHPDFRFSSLSALAEAHWTELKKASGPEAA